MKKYLLVEGNPNQFSLNTANLINLKKHEYLLVINILPGIFNI
jgi:hypothetical protein